MSNFVLENQLQLKRRHYLLMANAASHWFNAAPNVVAEYRAKFDERFCVVLWRSGRDDDAYVLPFPRIKSLFVEANLLIGKENRSRWHGGVVDGLLSLRGNGHSTKVGDLHNAFAFLEPKSA